MSGATTTAQNPSSTSDADLEEELIARARDLAPLVAKHADEASRLTRPVDEVIEALDAAELFKLTTPRNRGGYQVSMRTFTKVSEELAKADGSISWVTSIYNGDIFMLCSFPDDTLDELFTDGVPRVCCNFNPAGQAIPVDGGYRLTADWRFCTGQHHAKWAMMSSVIIRDGQDPDPAFFIMPRDVMTVADDWHVSGLRGSGSNMLSVKDLFVPEHMVQPLSVKAMSGTAAKSLAGDPYYAMPNVPFFTAGSCGTPLGLATAAIESFASRIHKRGITYTNYAKQSDAVVTHLQMDEALMRVDEARFHAERGAATLSEVSVNLADIAGRARIRADTAWCYRRAREAVEIARQAAGASALQNSNPLGRIVDDIEALSVHSFMVFSTNAELHGRVRCGLAPDTPFI